MASRASGGALPISLDSRFCSAAMRLGFVLQVAHLLVQGQHRVEVHVGAQAGKTFAHLFGLLADQPNVEHGARELIIAVGDFLVGPE